LNRPTGSECLYARFPIVLVALAALGLSHYGLLSSTLRACSYTYSSVSACSRLQKVITNALSSFCPLVILFVAHCKACERSEPAAAVGQEGGELVANLFVAHCKACERSEPAAAVGQKDRLILTAAGGSSFFQQFIYPKIFEPLYFRYGKVWRSTHF
jgi:hypothetical protein